MSFIDGKNYYEILGIERDASVEEIKVAYKEVARVYHPDSNFYSELVDQNLSNAHLEIFQVITSAYNTLVSKTKRVEYDKTLPPDLRGWTEEVDEDQEILEALEKIGVNPESVGIAAKPKRKRRSSDAFGVFGTTIEPESSEASLGSIQAQYGGISGFSVKQEPIREPKRPTFSSLIRPKQEEQRPTHPSPNVRQVAPKDPDTGIKNLLLLFVGAGSFFFAMSVVAFFMLK